MITEELSEVDIAARILRRLAKGKRMTCREIALATGVRRIEVQIVLRRDVRFELLHDGRWQLTRTETKGLLP